MTKPVSAIGIEPIDAMRKRIFTEGALREQIYDLLCEMRVPKLELVLHYCERVITERQAAAPPTNK